MNMTALLGSVTAVSLIVSVGCATPGYKEGDSAAGAMRAAAAESTGVQSGVDGTLSTLKDLMGSKNEDLRPKYEAFNGAVDKLRESISALQRRTDSMTSAANGHLKRWEEDLKKVTSEELRKKSQERRAEVQERVRKINELAAQTQTQASPALADLEDVRRVIGTDLSAGGVATVRDAAARAEVSGKALKESATKLASELEALANDIASIPAPPPPPPPPAKPAEPTK